LLREKSSRKVTGGGHVALGVSAAEGYAVLTVCDDGPGIPAAERVRAFERFYRVPGTATGGSGLGLSIVGRVVELLGGEIELSEPESGSGLIVRVSLPFGDAQAPGRTAA